jgi:hypothetical protein
MNTIDKMDKHAHEIQEITNKVIDLWQQEVVFSWRWWFGVSLTILAWFIWIKYHKKESRYRLLVAGFFVTTVSISLDALGVQLGLWSYRYQVLPIIPAYLPYDLSLMPVVIMFLIQVKPSYSPVKKSFIFGVLTAFLGEPLIVLTDIYNTENWRYYYSVPIYIIIYLASHWLITRKQFEKLN